MNVPVNNTFTNEAVLLNKNIKLVTEQDNAAQMIWLLLPVTETNTLHEHQVDLVQLKQEQVDTINGDIPKEPLAIEETNSVKSKTVKVENEVVTIDKGSIKGSIKISNECKCAYGDVTTEENLVENISSENVLFFQNGKKLVCEYCDERFRCKCYLKRPINFHCKKKIIVIFVKSLLFMITIYNPTRKIIFATFVRRLLIKVLI
ncbi:uncharacterized protein LOC142334149 isoform X2 [Lycorma delicatula]|uniref:uncharacterized protein LOC142334149 isoform X2 n=1 Tax=Lycorma delicatula TaxID=130591 RepID=UPI003F5120E1